MQFDPEIAKKIGVEEAIMLSNIEFWCEHNRANERHFYEGCYWTYNSGKAFCELFPFWTHGQIKRILKKLESNGYIKTGNFNQHKYDQTKWYSCIVRNKPNHWSKSANGVNETDQPIPDSKPDSKPDKSILEKFNVFWDSYQKKIDRYKCEQKWKKLKPEEVKAILVNVPLYVKKHPDEKFRKNPLTYLNGRCWEDEIEFEFYYDEKAIKLNEKGMKMFDEYNIATWSDVRVFEKLGLDGVKKYVKQ